MTVHDGAVIDSPRNTNKQGFAVDEGGWVHFFYGLDEVTVL
jgi:hypothetical protein